MIFYIPLIVILSFALLFGTFFVVKQQSAAIVERFGKFTGIRQSVIGATIIAIGTSLPELTVDIVAIKKRLLDLAIGDIIGFQ